GALNGANQVINTLDVRGGAVILGNDALTLGNDVTAIAGNGVTGTITSSATGTLFLATTANATRNFTIVDGGVQAGLSLTAQVAGTPTAGNVDSFTKLGSGTLLFNPAAADTYTGVTTVNA